MYMDITLELWIYCHEDLTICGVPLDVSRFTRPRLAVQPLCATESGCRLAGHVVVQTGEGVAVTGRCQKKLRRQTIWHQSRIASRSRSCDSCSERCHPGCKCGPKMVEVGVNRTNTWGCVSNTMVDTDAINYVEETKKPLINIRKAIFARIFLIFSTFVGSVRKNEIDVRIKMFAKECKHH